MEVKNHEREVANAIAKARAEEVQVDCVCV